MSNAEVIRRFSGSPEMVPLGIEFSLPRKDLFELNLSLGTLLLSRSRTVHFIRRSGRPTISRVPRMSTSNTHKHGLNVSPLLRWCAPTYDCLPHPG